MATRSSVSVTTWSLSQRMPRLTWTQARPCPIRSTGELRGETDAAHRSAPPVVGPVLPAGANQPGTAWHMLVLSPEEIAIKNAAVLAAARALRATGTDDAQGSREAALLARARRAELYIPLLP